jgi:hypothetical protein
MATTYSGSGPTDPTSTVQQQVGFAPQIAPYGEGVLAGAAEAVKAPYESYADWAKKNGLSGDQVAQYTDLQKQAFKGAQNLGQNQYSNDAAAGLASLSGQTFDQNTAQQYMNPYMQSVVDTQKREAQRQSGIQGTQQQAGAAQAGAFGGSRDAIMRAERERNLGQQMNDIQAQGSQAAFTNAQNQFNNQRQMGLQGYAALGSQGQNLYGQTTGNLNLQNQYGTQQQQGVQNMLNVGQQNYTNEMNYPYKQVGFMSDIVRGAPMSGLGSNVFQAPPSTLGQVATLGAAGMGLFGGTKAAAGGVIKSNRPTGLAALLVHGMA